MHFSVDLELNLSIYYELFAKMDGEK